MNERPRSSALSKKSTLLAGALAVGAMASQMEGCAPPTNLRDQAAQSEQLRNQSAEQINLALSSRLDFLEQANAERFAHEVGSGLQPGSTEYVAFANLEETARDVHGIMMRVAPELNGDQDGLRDAIFQQARARGPEWVLHTIEAVDQVRHLDDRAEAHVFLRLANVAQSPNVDPVALREFAREIHVERNPSDSLMERGTTNRRLSFTASGDEIAIAIDTLQGHWGNVGVSDASLRSVSIQEAHFLAATGLTNTGGRIVHELIEQHAGMPADTVHRIVLRNACQAEGRLFEESARANAGE